MRTRLTNLWDRLVGSFWFLPTLILVAAMLLRGFCPFLKTRRGSASVAADATSASFREGDMTAL